MSINLRDNSTETCMDIMKQDTPELKALLDVYPEKAAEKILANKAKLAKVLTAFGNMKGYSNVNNIVMNCDSRNCPHRQVCVLVENDMAPDGYSCPIEKKIIMEMEFDLVQSLAIDRNDPIEMEMLWDLIDIKLLDVRTSGALKDGRTTQIVHQQVAKIEQTKEEESPALLMKLELKKVKHSIMDAFLATRRSKKKYGMASDVNTLEALIMSAASKNRIEQKDE